MLSAMDNLRLCRELWASRLSLTAEAANEWESAFTGRDNLRMERAIREHYRDGQYPTPYLSDILRRYEAMSRMASEHEAKQRSGNASAEYAALAERCRQDAEGHRMLVDSLTADEIASTVKRVRQKTGALFSGWFTKAPAEWSKHECGFFAAQYDIDLRDATIAASRGVAA